MTDNDRLCVFDRFVMWMLILKQAKNNQAGLLAVRIELDLC